MARILQLNCARARHVMHDVGNSMLGEGISVALLQEPYTLLNCVRGLPSAMRVYCAGEGVISAAIVVNNDSFEVVLIPELCTGTGVCLSVESVPLGKLFLCSMYCRSTTELQDDLAYLERVLDAVGQSPLLIGMDANATSPLWFSKGLGRYGERLQRGRMIEDVALSRDLRVLNVPSAAFTFSGANGESDIDVTFVNRPAEALEWRWSVHPSWAHSDHNPLMVEVTFTRAPENTNELPPRWSVRGVDWNYYDEILRGQAGREVVEFAELDVDAMADTLTRWISRVNELVLRRRRRPRVKHTRWWTPELTSLRNECRRKRRIYQMARRDSREDLGACNLSYRDSLTRYKRLIKETKDKNWRRVILKGELSSNRPPIVHVGEC